MRIGLPIRPVPALATGPTASHCTIEFWGNVETEVPLQRHPHLASDGGICPATLGIVCFRRRVDGITDEDGLASINAGLAEARALVETTVREHQASAGEMIVRQWEASSDFYIVLEGTAEVRTAERHLAHLGPGDFFGELAALDWGASFGYPRLASVIATSPTRLLILPRETFRALIRTAPSFDVDIRRAVEVVADGRLAENRATAR